MIISFKCKETKIMWGGKYSKKFPFELQDRALRKLRLLNAATKITDLQNLPGNQLEYLKGDRKEQMSIRINTQWRICFIWTEGQAEAVEIVDYHK